MSKQTPRTGMSRSRPIDRILEALCAACGEIVVEINLLIDGEDLTMRSCSQCDTRSWHRGGAPVELGGILADLSSSPTRYRRDLASR
ncbi:MAG TPA: hypothetical protein PLV93_02420 [Microthrixaceae bacterium]|nr:hypothetical protein [Microthrixaceae bacterium]HNI34222.1 hypothetical protein [Microthrixaceae bacterium]